MSHEFLFYLEHIAADAGKLRLEGEEHHHLARVVRMRSGEPAFVTNGSGTIVECRVTGVEKNHTDLLIVRTVQTAKEQPLPVIALGCIKKERFERAVAYGTELGIEACIPLVSQNSSRMRYSEQYLTRLRAIALSAMKQSFRAVLPRVEAPLSLEDLTKRLPRFDSVIAGSQDSPPLSFDPANKRVIIIVGPESGFTPDERHMLERRGAVFASVSTRRLRSETAALVMLSIVNYSRQVRQSN